MKYNIFFKLFTLVFIFIFFAVPVFAENTEPNILSKIEVDKTKNSNYRIVLFFNEKYTGSAFIQNKKNGSYFVFIPDTILNPKNTKIVYNDKRYRENIKIDVEQKPFIKENYQSSYLRLSVDILDNNSLKLVSKTIEEESNSASFLSLNLFSFLMIILAAVAVFMISRIIKISKVNKNTKSFTSFPVGYLNNSINYEANYEPAETIEQNIQKPVLPKVNIRKTLRSHDSDSFSCFEIPLTDDAGQTDFEFKSTLKQTSVIQKERNAKSKQTNPIRKSTQDDASEFELPIVEDIISPVKKQKEEKTAPELLSELKITPTKGFYLTTADDNFALFGFVNDKIFLLKKFTDLSQINLQARFYDKHGNKDLYVVRLDSYKAMIEISETGMQELAVL